MLQHAATIINSAYGTAILLYVIGALCLAGMLALGCLPAYFHSMAQTSAPFAAYSDDEEEEDDMAGAADSPLAYASL